MNEVKDGLNVIGEIKDIITYEDGTVEEREWERNLVVSSINLLIAGLLKGEMTKGIRYWAIGSGAPSWDTSPVEPKISDTKCQGEIYRKLIPSNAITYVDNSGKSTAYPTNRIQISLVFEPGEGTGKWREFCIFGGDGATATANSGIALNHRIHGLIDKTSTMSVERILRFTFA